MLNRAFFLVERHPPLEWVLFLCSIYHNLCRVSSAFFWRGNMEQLLEWMEIIEDVRQHRKVRHIKDILVETDRDKENEDVAKKEAF